LEIKPGKPQTKSKTRNFPPKAAERSCETPRTYKAPKGLRFGSGFGFEFWGRIAK